jgi:hypothetical protein
VVEPVAQGGLLVRGDEELVAELAAVADAPGDDVLESTETKVPE